MPDAPRNVPGYRADFVDDFKTPLNTAVWGRYEGGPAVGTTSIYRRDNALVHPDATGGDGQLRLSTTQSDGGWSSAGLSTGRGFAAAQGKWAIKAKFDDAPGVGYAFLLYPRGGGWPPEIDIAEGSAMTGAHIMSTMHYGTVSDHRQIQRWLHGVDLTQWHTYGVVINGDVIEFTLDGRVWGKIEHAATPRVPMWLGLQAGVKDCARSTGECLSARTPVSSNISVDWVAHYEKV